jgi:hypothetical protein
MKTIRVLLLAALISVVACGCAPEPAPQADDVIESPAIAADVPQAAPRPDSAPPSDNTVDLTFAGAFSARLSGKAGRCSLRRSGPIPGATWQVRSEELGVAPTFSLTIIAQPDAFDDPSIVVNVTGENRASYARRAGSRDERLALAQDAMSADVDVELKLVGTTSESLRVTGTIRCSAPFVTE